MSDGKVESKFKGKVRPNFEWPPERYYRLGVYVMLFNAIANDAAKFGIDVSNGDQVINSFILDNLDKLLAPESDTNPLGVHKNGIVIPSTAGGVSKFKEDFPNLVAEAKELSKVNHTTNNGYINGMLSNQEMQEILTVKRNDVKKHYNQARKNSKVKSGEYDEDGKPKFGIHAQAYLQATKDLKNKKANRRKSIFKGILKTLAGVGSAALAVGSVALLISSGGAALPGLFGSVFQASAAGRAVAGLIGTIGGGVLAKEFTGSAITEWATAHALGKDQRNYMRGIGKYTMKDGKELGYREIEQRYWEDKAIKSYYENNGQIPKGKWVRKKVKRFGKVVEKAIFVKDPDYPKLIRAYKNAQKRGDVAFWDFDKDVKYYQFVNTEFVEGKKDAKTGATIDPTYGFKYLEGLLGSAKSMNVNDALSIQGETYEAEQLLKKGNATTNEVVRKILNLTKAESKFEGDSAYKYQELMFGFSDKIMECMDRELFENSYTSDLVRNMKTIYEMPEVKARFEKTREGNCTEVAENAFKFIENLRTDTFAGGVLDDKVDASIEQQVNMTSANMKQACSKYGVPDAEITVVESICNDIAAISARGDAADANASAQIASLSNAKAKRYLTYMREKKINETTHSTASIAALATSAGVTIPPTIVTQIAGISKTTTPSQIEIVKQNIMADPTLSLAANEEARKLALAAVQTQVESIERKKRNESISAVVGCIRNNSFHEYAEYMDKIPKDDVEEINPENLAIVLKDFKKVQPTEMSNFLIFKLKDKVASILKRKATSPKFDTTGGKFAETIEALQKYITNIGNCVTYGIIDEWQKNECSKAIEPKIISAFGPHLKKLEEEFFKDVDGTRLLAEQYLKEMKLGGFSEFLNSNTPEALDLKNRITRIYDATNLSDMMNAEGKGGSFGSHLVCADSGETKKSLRIYFLKERADGDVLYDILKDMRTISQNTGGFSSSEDPEVISATSNSESTIFGGGPAVAVPDLSKSFVHRINNEILNNLDVSSTPCTYNGRDLSAEDALAALLVLKKRTLAMLKAQMNRLYIKHRTSGESVQNFAIRNFGDMDKLTAKWETISRTIDGKISVLQGKVRTEFKGYVSCENCVRAGTSGEKYSSYVASAEM